MKPVFNAPGGNVVAAIKSAVVFCALSATAPPAAGGISEGSDEPGYFYKGLGYGSDAAFNPVSELVNGAFGVLQITSNWAALDELDLAHGLEVTWESVTHPGRTVRSYGPAEFLTNEVIPGQFRWSGLQYVPNYHLHLIGGGARHRAFVEWYRAHGFSHPGWWAVATTVAHSFAVEAVEHHAARTATVDPVADMLLFDPAGAVLFSFDRVARFFARTLNMSIWSGQPMYNPVANTFENAGQNYGLHFFFSEGHRVGVFQYWGMSDLFGVTVRRESGLDWSVGVGAIVAELREEERGAGMSAFYARLDWDAGVFLHEDGSLLASLHVSESWTQRIRFNLYPGVARWRGISPGVFLGVRESDVMMGISVASTPIGFAVSQ